MSDDPSYSPVCDKLILEFGLAEQPPKITFKDKLVLEFLRTHEPGYTLGEIAMRFDIFDQRQTLRKVSSMMDRLVFLKLVKPDKSSPQLFTITDAGCREVVP